MGRLEGKVAVITGAGSGIGRASALRFAEEGVRVVSVDQIVERLEGRREATGVNYVTVPRKQIDDFAPVVARLAGR